MPENETNNNSLVPIHNTGLIKVGNIIKITDKVLKEYSERALSVFYKSVIIGEQEWMVENLNVDRFRNGEPITEAKFQLEWNIHGLLGEPVWCNYDNEPENGKKYGKLYNWYAINDLNGLAPKGWHIPSIEEWNQLINYIGGDDNAYKLKSQMDSNDIDYNQTGFTALFGGYCDDERKFSGIDNEGYWWTSTEKSSEWAIIRHMLNDNIYVGKYYYIKTWGFSVRCIKDKI